MQLLIAVNKKEAYQECTSRVIYQCIFVHILFENVVLVVKKVALYVLQRMTSCQNCLFVLHLGAIEEE